jgi:hypothetical protein
MTFGGSICERHRPYLPICFLPKIRESIEKAPGPINASVAPTAANKISLSGFPGSRKAIRTSNAATTTPAKGVHNPIMIKIARIVPIDSEIEGVVEVVPLNNVVLW